MLQAKILTVLTIQNVWMIKSVFYVTETSTHSSNEHKKNNLIGENSSKNLIKHCYMKTKILLMKVFLNNGNHMKCIMIPMFPL